MLSDLSFAPMSVQFCVELTPVPLPSRSTECPTLLVRFGIQDEGHFRRWSIAHLGLSVFSVAPLIPCPTSNFASLMMPNVTDPPIAISWLCIPGTINTFNVENNSFPVGRCAGPGEEFSRNSCSSPINKCYDFKGTVSCDDIPPPGAGAPDPRGAFLQTLTPQAPVPGSKSQATVALRG